MIINNSQKIPQGLLLTIRVLKDEKNKEVYLIQNTVNNQIINITEAEAQLLWQDIKK